MTAPSSPLRPSALALLITTAVTGAVCTAAVAAAPPAVRVPLAWFSGAGVLLLAVAAFAVVWSTRTARLLRRRISGLGGELAARDAHIARLTADAARDAAAHTAERNRLTAAHSAELDRLAAAHAAQLDTLAATGAASRQHLADELRRAESGRAAAMAAAANAAGRMQALATGMLADLRDMEHRHADEDVLGDLLHLDHRTAQAGRLADSIAVLTGARSGRRWAKPIVMESVLRGAMGRIGGYQRVRLHSTSDAAVAGHAAEGVMHALAELLDNAANFSPPSAEVHVYVEEVPAGIVITVEDSGLVMSEVQLRRAEQAVSAESLDLAGLSGTRLGLAVVGRLARKHGLTVSFRPSARGGTGALMMLPQELISHGPAEAVPAPATAAAPEPAPAPAVLPAPARDGRTGDRTHARADDPAPQGGPRAAEGGSATGPDPAPGSGGSGLPQRRRGQTLAAAQPGAGRTPDGAEAAPRTGETPTGAHRPATRFGTFREAVRGPSAHPAHPQRHQNPQTPQHPEGTAQ
ncbi:sensor histidine kinase [Streptomyces sp. NPDC058646]|uniref:sensor histidine kinase n=1 Tax=Streptomyces sp. NPDC058646 TaxID=3346574 RepID=UPI00364E31CA